ncbi:glycosyl hydrolase, partial [Streptomyces sp. WAC02707]|uniref:glycosyl hydrolase family 18 protein n=1 Tax=Streptomyces sp. WAC02707 TaxID=2487417 RepID=UPI000F94537E
MRPRAMSKPTFGAVAAVTLGLLATLAPAADAHQAPHGAAHESSRKPSHGQDLKRIGYFTQWGIYGRNFQVKDLETSGTAAKLIHINYAFGVIGPDGKCLMGNAPGSDPWADYVRPVDAANSVDGAGDTADQRLAGNFNELRELKAKHPGLKVMISLGGWSGSAHFSDAVRTDAGRKALVAS